MRLILLKKPFRVGFILNRVRKHTGHNLTWSQLAAKVGKGRSKKIIAVYIFLLVDMGKHITKAIEDVESSDRFNITEVNKFYDLFFINSQGLSEAVVEDGVFFVTEDNKPYVLESLKYAYNSVADVIMGTGLTL